MATSDLTLGRGKLYIAERSAAAYQDADFSAVGNVKEFTLEPSEETLEHYDYQTNTKTKDAEVTTDFNVQGSFIADHITNANIQRYLRATKVGKEIRAVQALGKRYALKFVQDNAEGPNRTYIFHKVKLTSGGALGLISDEYQEMQFSFSGLKDTTYYSDSPLLTIFLTTTTTTTTTT